MKIRFELVPEEKFILRPQIRNHSPEYLRRLADSLRRGQLQPVGALKDYSVVFGNGRVLAARLEPKITHLYAAIMEEEISEREFKRRQAVENFVSNELSNADKCKICVEYAKSEPSLSLKQIAGDLGVDASLVTRWMAWEKCIDRVRQALAANQITLTAMYSLSQLPQDQQASALDLALNAPNAAAVTRAVRKQRNGSSTVRTTRVKLQTKDVCVTLAGEGEGMTISDIIETLATLLKEAKRADEQGLDSKTFSAVMRDKSKSGA